MTNSLRMKKIFMGIVAAVITPSTDPGTMFVARTPTTAQSTIFSGNFSGNGWSAGPDGGALNGLNGNSVIGPRCCLIN